MKIGQRTPKRDDNTPSKMRLRESPNRPISLNKSKLDSDSDSEIEKDLPIHPKGYKDQWAAMAKMADDEELEKVSYHCRNSKTYLILYRQRKSVKKPK